jgi:hypothetical protein
MVLWGGATGSDHVCMRSRKWRHRKSRAHVMNRKYDMRMRNRKLRNTLLVGHFHQKWRQARGLKRNCTEVADVIVCAYATGTFCTTTIVVVPLRITDRATGSDVTPEVGVSRRFWGCFGICCVVLPRSHCVFFFFFIFLVQVWQCFFMKFT